MTSGAEDGGGRIRITLEDLEKVQPPNSSAPVQPPSYGSVAAESSAPTGPETRGSLLMKPGFIWVSRGLSERWRPGASANPGLSMEGVAPGPTTLFSL